MKVLKTRITTMCLLILYLSGCASASGSVIITGEKRKPIDPAQVKLYLQPPANYKIIGLVNASSDASWTEQGSVDYAIEELKNQAADIGANGVLITATGDTTSTAVGGYGTEYLYTIPVTVKTVSGKASKRALLSSESIGSDSIDLKNSLLS